MGVIIGTGLLLASLAAMVLVFLGLMGAAQTRGFAQIIVYGCMLLALAVPLSALWAWGRWRVEHRLWPIALVLLHLAAVPAIFTASTLLRDSHIAPVPAAPRLAGTDAASWAAFTVANPDPEAADLSRLGLDAVPEEVFRLRRLRELNLSGNRITAIPDALLALPELRVLLLRDNPVPMEELRRFSIAASAALASGRRAHPLSIVQ